MSPLEISYRIVRAISARVECRGLRRNRVPSARLTNSGARFIDCAPDVDAAAYVAAADRIVGGRLDVFALQDIDIGQLPCWNRDPKTGVVAPLVFGKLLNYRDPGQVGDIKYLWELNRHQHLVTLAQSHALTGRHRYTHCLRDHLESWIRDCPFRFGPNWSSALEPAIRLINWSLAWQLVGGIEADVFKGAAGTDFRDRWLRSIYQHARFVQGNFSQYSSANNHLIGEAAGVFIASVTWPFWPDMQRWRARSVNLLEREVQRQNAPDGVNREQAVSYQQFEYDLMLLCWQAGKQHGCRLSDGFAKIMERMVEFVAAIMDVDGNVPMIGDSDDGFVVRLAQEPGFCRYRSMLASGAVLFDRHDFRQKAGVLDDKTRWLIGPSAVSAWQKKTDPTINATSRRAFPTGGYYVLGCHLETDAEIRLVADAGPLGYQAIAAHGHADALSFTLSVGGREILIDPGTFTYHSDDSWRQYFRGTSAHNTLRIDDKDQSEPGGNFMWIKKARAGCTLWRSDEFSDDFEGWHDGYRRLADSVMHRRRLVLDKRLRRIDVEDHLIMRRTHRIELFFHLSECCRVERRPNGFLICNQDSRAVLSLPIGKTRVYRGSENPILGWVSRRYDQRVPSPTIVWRATLTGSVILRSSLQC